MKQVHTNCFLDTSARTITALGAATPASNVFLVVNSSRGAIYYNFSSGPRITTTNLADGIPGYSVSTLITLDNSVSLLGHSNSDSIVIFYDNGILDEAIISGLPQCFQSSLVSAGVPQGIFNSNAARKYLSVQNLSDSNLRLFVGSPSEGEGMVIPPGEIVSFNNFVPTGAISMSGPAGEKFIAYQWPSAGSGSGGGVGGGLL